MEYYILDKPLDLAHDSDSDLLNSNSMSLDQSAASIGRPSVGSAIRDAIAQSMSGCSDPAVRRENRTGQTNRARSEGSRSIPDEHDNRRKSMPDRVAEMLAEVTTSHMVRELICSTLSRLFSGEMIQWAPLNSASKYTDGPIKLGLGTKYVELGSMKQDAKFSRG